MNSPREVRTLGIVLRRTNYAEADRILNLITPTGKVSAIAKGVRKEKSKLAGGIEMFSVGDFHIHFARGGMGVITGAKMVRNFAGILKSLERTELAAEMLKKVALAAEGTGPEGGDFSAGANDFFRIIEQGLSGLEQGLDKSLVEAWFYLRLARARGEEMNLYRDVQGEKLSAGARYDWDNLEIAFYKEAAGKYGADEIKMMRFLTVNDLGVAGRVKTTAEMVRKILDLARIVGKV